jgi:hypothetical protein
MNGRLTLSAALTAGLLGCSDKASDTSGNEDSGEVTSLVSIDCATVTSVMRSWGGSTGPCGPEYILSVDAEGSVSTSATEAYPPEGSEDCDTVTSESTIEATDAGALLLTVCEEFNACEESTDIVQDDGGWDAIGLYTDGEVLVSSADIYCDAGLTASSAALDAVWSSATSPD